MRLVEVLVVCALVGLTSAGTWREIVANEDDLLYTCTKSCSEVGTLSHQEIMLERNCKTVKGCTTMSHGWTRGFVRCDFCRCQCEDSRQHIPEVVKVQSKKEITEPDLYGTCTTKCPKSGLVRTNFKGCKEVRNCKHARNGWTRGFVRCDYCLCDCINYKTVASYRLEDVEYSLDEGNANVAKPSVLKRTYLENNTPNKQKLSRSVSYEYTNSIEVSTTLSLTTGLSLTVEAGVNVGIASASSSTTASIEAGFESSMGEVTTESHTDTIEASMEVDPGQQCEMLVIGSVMTIDVPYTATIVKTYDDGSEDRESTSGIFGGVETTEFRVQYGNCIAL